MALVTTCKFVIILYISIFKPDTERNFSDICMVEQSSLESTDFLLATTALDVAILGGIPAPQLRNRIMLDRIL